MCRVGEDVITALYERQGRSSGFEPTESNDASRYSSVGLGRERRAPWDESSLKGEAVVEPRLAIGRILGTPFEGMKIVAKTRSTAAMSPRPARSGRGERRRILAAKW